MSINDRLKTMQIQLPKSAEPLGFYKSSIIINNTLHISGQLPMVNGELKYSGKAGNNILLDEAKSAIEVSVLNAIAIAKVALDGDLERITGVQRLRVYINSINTFADHATLANSASQLLLGVFGDIGAHSRSTVGVSSLPLNALVEVELDFAIST